MSNLFWSSNLEHQFLVEGTINTCNSMFYWLEDHLNIPHEKMKWDERCEKTKTEGVLVPGFTGITSPYWVQPKETLFYNLNDATKDEIIVTKKVPTTNGAIPKDFGIKIGDHLFSVKNSMIET